MDLENIWLQWSNRQLNYVIDIIKNSDAKSVCEIGSFVGSVARPLWNGIKDTNKKLYLVDNYHFLPENARKSFFKFVKKSIGDSEKIYTILEDSHKYNWDQHDFIIFSHGSYEHMIPDFNRLLQSNVKYAIIDITPTCFERFNLLLHSVVTKESNLKLQYYIDGIFVLGREKLNCTLPTKKELFFHEPIQYVEKESGSYIKAINNIKAKLGIKQ